MTSSDLADLSELIGSISISDNSCSNEKLIEIRNKAKSFHLGFRIRDVDSERQSYIANINKTTVPLFSLSDSHFGTKLKQLFYIMEPSAKVDRDKLEICAEVLGCLLPLFSKESIFQSFHHDLLRGLYHKNENIQQLSLTELSVLVGSMEGCRLLMSSQPILTALILCVGSENLSVVKLSTSVLLSLCNSVDDMKIIFAADNFSTLTDVMKKSSSALFNVHELATKAGLLGSAQMDVIFEVGLIDKLLTEVTGDDILSQLNALELLYGLTSNSQAVSHMNSKGIFSNLQNIICEAHTEIASSFLLNGVLKVFGNFGNAFPILLTEQFPKVVRAIVTIAGNQQDMKMQLVAIETICHIGSCVEGKLCLSGFGDEMMMFLETLSSFIQASPSDIRVRALSAVTELMTLKPESEKDPGLQVIERWWAAFSRNGDLQDLFHLLKQPFSEVRECALEVLIAISRQPWGQRLINTEPGLLEFILDRSTAYTTEASHLKYGVVASLVESPFSRTIFNDSAVVCLEEYFEQGIFYTRAQAEVTMERGDG